MTDLRKMEYALQQCNDSSPFEVQHDLEVELVEASLNSYTLYIFRAHARNAGDRVGLRSVAKQHQTATRKDDIAN